MKVSFISFLSRQAIEPIMVLTSVQFMSQIFTADYHQMEVRSFSIQPVRRDFRVADFQKTDL